MSSVNPYYPTNDEIKDIEDLIESELNMYYNAKNTCRLTYIYNKKYNIDLSKRIKTYTNISIILDQYKATKPSDDLINQARLEYSE